jgi:hypothetical protein
MTALTLFVTAILIVLAGVLFFATVPVVRTYFTYRGKRLVTCPETLETASVDVAARKAALGAIFGEPKLHLDRCSRWPERQGCGQDCLQQIETDPDNCLLWNVVSNWYEGQSCAYCHRRFGRLGRMDHAPALLGLDNKTVEWNQLQPEKLPQIFATYKPVCWNCHITETFRHLHPDLVVDRKRIVHHHTN